MSSRYFVSPPISQQSRDHVVLDGPEAHHLLHVMRAARGDEITLFDGSGLEYRARIETLARASVELAVLEQLAADRELPFSLTLGAALPKGDRQKWLVEKATELGVTRLVPLVAERGVAQPTDSALERLRRSVIEASKQCGRNRLMESAEPLAWNEFIGAAPATATRLVAHPGGQTCDGQQRRAEGVYLGVGPEGGLTDAEADVAVASGWQLIDLGPRILRVETAALALAGLVGLSAR